MTVCVTESIRGITAQLDALQGFVEAKREEAIAAGRQAGDGAPHLNSRSSGAGGEAAGSNRNSAGVAARGSSSGGRPGAPAAPSVDPLETVQGLVHSDVVLSQLKGQVYGFTSSLKHILQVRTESLKAQATRRRHFGGTKDLGKALGGGGGGSAGEPTQPTAAAGAPGGGAGAGGARAAHAKPLWSATPAAAASGGGGFGALSSSTLSSALHGGSAHGGDAIISIGPSPAAPSSLFAPVSASQLQALSEGPHSEAAVLAARASDVAVLERQIGELSGLFSRLASMIAEQGNLVDRLEDDSEAALSRLEAGTAQLERYRARVTNNKTLALKVASILIAFLIFFVLFGV